MSRTLLSEAALQLQQTWCNDYFLSRQLFD